MNFKSRLNYIFENMGFTNVEVAHLGGLDASLISRFRTGKRIPSKRSHQIYCLCKGLIIAAKEHETVEQLCCLCKINITTDEDLILQQLLIWFETSDLKEERKSKSEFTQSCKSVKKLKAFSEKLHALMETFDISNIKLARVMHIDASLVSRFRSGMRIPTTNSWFPQQFCQWLADKTAAYSHENVIELLLPLMGEPIPQKTQDLKKRLLEWMQSEPETVKNIITSSFLDKLNSCEPVFEVPQKIIDSLPITPDQKPNSEIFHGIEGLRKAVIQFLTLAAIQNEPGTLYLYSDQPMDWMIGDTEFTKLWASLMSIVLYRKNQICIIHNIHRSLTEMFDAIQKWIPLYMTGLIKPYYSENKQDSNFCQTKFILPGKCSINASFVNGTQNSAEYEFCTEKSRISYHCRQFNELLNNSRPLINVFALKSPVDFKPLAEASISNSGQEIHLRYTMPISTMPDDTFEKILSRSSLSDEEKASAEEYRNNNISGFLHALEGWGVTDLIALPEEDCIKSRKIKIDLPKTIIGKTLFYDTTEFSSHIANIKNFLLKNKNYRMYILPESPFENVFITVLGNTHSIVVKINDPSTVFLFDHPLMNRTFSSYLNSLAQKVMPGDYNRYDIISSISKYIL